MKKEQCENTAEVQHENSAIQKKWKTKGVQHEKICNMKWVQHEESAG